MTEEPDPTPAARWTLRWSCPRCQRTWLAAHAVHTNDRLTARVMLSERAALTCGRCGKAWDPLECGIDWQPENKAAADSLMEPSR